MIDELDNIFKNINNWLEFAEKKNATLLALNIGVVWGVSRILMPSKCVNDISFWFNIVGYFLILVSIFIGVVSFLPVLKGIWIKKEEPLDADNCIFFSHISKYTNRGYLSLLSKKLGLEGTKYSGYELDISSQIVINSTIALEKFNQFVLSAYLTVISVVLFVASIGLNYIMENPL